MPLTYEEILTIFTNELEILSDKDYDLLKGYFGSQEKIEVNKIIDPTIEYKVKLNFCPKCKSRLKIDEEECPSCGINIKEYLYNN